MASTVEQVKPVVRPDFATVIGRTIWVVVPHPVRQRNRPQAGNKSNVRRMSNLAVDWGGTFS